MVTAYSECHGLQNIEQYADSINRLIQSLSAGTILHLYRSVQVMNDSALPHLLQHILSTWTVRY